MKNKTFWIDFSILNLCIVALFGMTLRSKMLFSMPFLNFNNLLEAHYHFAIAGWVTLALLVLMMDQFFTGPLPHRQAYQWLLGGIVACAWGMLITFCVSGNGILSDFFSFLFIFITYTFGWMLIKDIRKTGVSKTVALLSRISIACLILSSAGPWMLACLFSMKSLDAILYRDALFTYLHFTYNGFFSLAVFSLLIHKAEPVASAHAKKNMHRFAVLLCSSLLPSLFLSYLWQDPNAIFRVIAITGSLLLLLTLTGFIITVLSLRSHFKILTPVMRNIGLVSLSAFMLKLLLQSFTIYTPVGNAVFGDRPMIIGYLHLVFLVFVTLFILLCFISDGILNIQNKFTKAALITFATGVVLNEAILMGQGLVAMFIKSNRFFPMLLWLTSIVIFLGACSIAVARRKATVEADDRKTTK